MKPNISLESLIESLQNRIAVKDFKTNGMNDHEKNDSINALKEILRLTPSSYGLQPYRCLFISNPDIQHKLKSASFDQPQITDSDFLIVFCIVNDIDEAFIDEYLDLVSTIKNVSQKALQPFKNALITNIVEGFGNSERKNWAIRQAYIALGNSLSSLAMLGIDCCPIEGFENQKYDSILNLTEKNLSSCVVLAVGKRNEENPSQKSKKVRLPIDKLFLDVK